MIIKGGRVVLSDRIETKDIKIEDGIIVRIDDHITPLNNEPLIDVEGRYVLPGLIDIHTHLDDQIGRYTLADDFYTGSLIALKNGVTTIYNFITEQPHRPLREGVEYFLKKGFFSMVNYGFHLTPVRYGERDLDYIKRLIDRGFVSFKFYTTYKNAGIYISYDEILEFVERVKRDETLFLIHCEDEEVLSEYYCYQYQEPIDHFNFRPEEAEVEAIRRIIEIASKTGAHFHVVHCSTERGARLIKEAREKVRLTVETCPQYLTLSNLYLRREDGHRYFCTPPIRSMENVHQMRTLAINGAFDIFTTDHAPFLKRDKDENKKELRSVPNGLPGLGALVHIIFALYKEGGVDPYLNIAKRLSENPARIMNIYPRKGAILEGSDADLIVLSEGETEERIIPTLQEVYNPYEEFTSKLRIDYVIINGDPVVVEGRVVNESHRGRCLNVPKGI